MTPARQFLVFLRDQLRVNRDERSGQHTFSEEVLQKVRDLQSGFERTRRRRVAEVVREDAFANETGDAAQEDSRRNEKRKSRTRSLLDLRSVGWVRTRGIHVDIRAIR